MTFAGDLKKFKHKYEDNGSKVFRGTVLDFFSKVVMRTPIDTGRLRGNWQISLTRFPTGEVDTIGQGAITAATGTIGKAEIGDTAYISNNLPYAMTIENGSSRQAPQGMVKVTVAEFDNIVKKASK